MATATEDPPSDVAQRSQAALLREVGRVSYQHFMGQMVSIMDSVSQQQSADSFYSQRGLAVSSLEVLGYEALDANVADALQSTIVESVKQINRLQQAKSAIDVNTSQLNGEIRLATLETDLIKHRATNNLLLAVSEGVTEGTRLVEEARTFLDGLGDSVNASASRVDMYRKYHEELAVNNMTRLFSDGPSKLYLHANDTGIILAKAIPRVRSEL
ncbi:unnamed protein product [Effrenium voratum]|uniref:Uncharacterized protein n=1 Tax=Effrenium voratum TaxID=2562239 RepID=A0AA36IQ89_9DINO|nr:unnamed protein product [Effrenium voratum]